jgi:hypothetical protein
VTKKIMSSKWWLGLWAKVWRKQKLNVGVKIVRRAKKRDSRELEEGTGAG